MDDENMNGKTKIDEEIESDKNYKLKNEQDDDNGLKIIIKQETKNKEQEKQSVITYQNSNKNTMMENVGDKDDNDENKRLWERSGEEEEEECKINCDNDMDKRNTEIHIVNCEHQYSKEPNRIMMKSKKFDVKNEGDDGDDERQRGTSQRESAIHFNDDLNEQETKVILHSNNQYVHQNKENSVTSSFLTTRNISGDNYVKEEYHERDDLKEEEGEDDEKSSYKSHKIMACLPDFQQSYGEAENLKRKNSSRYGEKHSTNYEPKKIIRLDKNPGMASYTIEQNNKSTVHHYPDRDLYINQGIQNVENMEQNNGYSDRLSERGIEFRNIEMRYIENVKVDPSSFSVMTHAERDPMLGDSYSASPKIVSYPIEYQKIPGGEYHVKYEDNNESGHSRRDLEQHNNQLIVKNSNQIIHSDILQSNIPESAPGPTTTYTTLQTVSHPPSNAYNNLYPQNEYHDTYVQKPSNPTPVYEIHRNNEDIYNKTTGEVCYRNKLDMNHGYGSKVPEGPVIGYPSAYITDDGQRLTSIGGPEEVHTEFVIKHDGTTSIIGSNKTIGEQLVLPYDQQHQQSHQSDSNIITFYAPTGTPYQCPVTATNYTTTPNVEYDS